MSDLVQRLREHEQGHNYYAAISKEAADALEAQQREIERLRVDAERFRYIYKMHFAPYVSGHGDDYVIREDEVKRIDEQIAKQRAEGSAKP